MKKVESGGYFGMDNFKWTMNPDTTLVSLERATQSWDSPPKTWLWGNYWQDDTSVDVTVLLGTQMKDDQLLGSSWQG